jgi:hypothetical protein
MRKYFFTALAIVATCIVGQGQSVTPAITNAGGGFYQDRYSKLRYFDWSIGELTLVHTAASQDNSVVVYQGVLQPCTEKPGYSPSTANFEPNDFTIYPNPTTGKFELNFFVRASGTMNLVLTDMLGRQMETRNFRYFGCCRIEHYDISHLPAGIYLIAATLIPDVEIHRHSNLVLKHSGLKVIKQ